MMVVVHIYTITVPFPIAAAVQIVVRNNPVRIVVEDYAPRPVVDPARDECIFHVHVVTVWVGVTGPDAVVVVVPTPIVVAVPMFVPALVLSVVMPVAIIVHVLVLTFMLTVIVPVTLVVAVLARRCDRHCPC